MVKSVSGSYDGSKKFVEIHDKGFHCGVVGISGISVVLAKICVIRLSITPSLIDDLIIIVIKSKVFKTFILFNPISMIVFYVKLKIFLKKEKKKVKFCILSYFTIYLLNFLINLSLKHGVKEKKN